jgi:predicted lipid-binding transport protein (Tim44 family)
MEAAMSIPLSRGLILRGSALDGRALFGATVALCLSVTGTLAGPCTAQIAELEQRVSPAPVSPAPVSPAPVSPAPASPQNTPSAPQSVAAQLHRQPTPTTVQSAAGRANAEADAAVDRARKSDAENDADGCNEALREARRLYGE